MACMRRAAAAAVLVSCLALLSFHAEVKALPRGPSAPMFDKDFNVLQFGAKSGGEHDCTEAFMKTWVAACQFKGRARVVVPPGIFKASSVLFGGPCSFPITLEISGTMKADTDLSNYPNEGWIVFDHIDGLVVTGGGTFHGQGEKVWRYNDCKTNPSCTHLNPSIYMNNVRNAKFQGIHSVNSMGFHMHVTNCNNIRLQGLSLTAPKDSPNTDGIHISSSLLVKIGKSIIATGDDCVSIGQGSMNVSVNRVVCGPGHGISIGSLGKLPNEKDVRGVIIKNCTLTETTNGIRIKTWSGSEPSSAAGFLFTGITMKNVKNPIIIDQEYGSRSRNKPSQVKISNVVYQNIEGTTGTPVAVKLVCSKKVPCENLSFNNIHLKPNRTNIRLSSTCVNVRAGYSGAQFPAPCS